MNLLNVLFFFFIFKNLQEIESGPIGLIEFVRNTLAMDTTSVDQKKTIRFLLYTRKEPRNPKFLMVGNHRSIDTSGFDSRHPVLILTHGYNMRETCTFPQEIKNAYFDAGYDMNIITTDWEGLAKPFDFGPADPETGTKGYIAASKNIEIVGQAEADLIEFVVVNNYTTLDNIHLIGFSLGAHAAGYCGDIVNKKIKKQIWRITALDPAGPLFEHWFFGLLSFGIGRHLQKGDARFVDIVHTNKGFLGSSRSEGDFNFFVNGGSVQPDCIDRIVYNNTITETFWDVPRILAGSCSHNMAPIFYKLSIGKTIAATRCFRLNESPYSKQCFINSGTFGDKLNVSMEPGEYYLDMRALETVGPNSCP